MRPREDAKVLGNDVAKAMRDVPAPESSGRAATSEAALPSNVELTEISDALE